jgi:hypothetical protein
MKTPLYAFLRLFYLFRSAVIWESRFFFVSVNPKLFAVGNRLHFIIFAVRLGY